MIFPSCSSCNRVFGQNETAISIQRDQYFHDRCSPQIPDHTIVRFQNVAQRVRAATLLDKTPSPLQKLSLEINWLAAKNFRLTQGSDWTISAILADKESDLRKLYPSLKRSDVEKIARVADALFLRKSVNELSKSGSFDRIWNVYFMIEKERFLELSSHKDFATDQSRKLKDEYLRVANIVQSCSECCFSFLYALSFYGLYRYTESKKI